MKVTLIESDLRNVISLTSEAKKVIEFKQANGRGPAGQDGEDGREVQIQNNGTHIQWRYEGDVSWTDIVALSTLVGPAGNDGTDGSDGADGVPVELQVGLTHIQWRLQGEPTWTDLISIASITGADGTDGADGADGADGREVEIQNSGTHIQWKYVGDPTWTDIIAISAITGADGTNGTDGSDGADGREVEIQNSGTHIQWRYVGDVSWINLVELAAISGSDGTDGSDGSDGADGREVEIQNNGTHIQWRYVGDVSWINIVALSAITGPAGNDGADGTNGTDGTDGDNAWTPELAVVNDGERRVLQVVDWFGGEGTKPATGQYVGATGLEALIANGVDIRGAQGAAGSGSGDMLASEYDTNNDKKVNAADTADSVPWSGVTSKPSTFPPDTHTHAFADITSKPSTYPPDSHTHPWSDVTSKPSTFPPDSHNHDDRYYTETETDSLLSGKSDTSHTHAWGDITSKPTEFTPSAHTHPWSEVTSKPSTFPPDAHNHDDRYYTETETDTLLAGKAASSHTHTASEITDFDTEVANNPAVAANTAKVSYTDGAKVAGIESGADVTDAENVGSSIHGSAAKVTPVDADTVPLIDSAASNVLKKLSWSNLKATLKSYFDTLYSLSGHNHDERYYTETETDSLLSGKQNTLGFTPENSANKNQPSGYAGLDSGGKINPSQLPAIALTEVFQAANEVEHLAISAQEGDVVVRTDESKTYIHNGGTSGTMSDYTELANSTGGVTSFNSRTGAVTPQSGDYDLSEIDETGTYKRFTATEQSKLSNIEANADVTDAGNVGSSIHGSSDKATPVDADALPLIDSAASNVLKKLSWANIKATLKTYFDTLYATGSHTHAWSAITDKPGTFPPESHNHDERYYTESETDSLLSGKAAASHSHAWGDITSKPSTFPPDSHSHSWGEITDKPTSFDPTYADLTDLRNGTVTNEVVSPEMLKRSMYEHRGARTFIRAHRGSGAVLPSQGEIVFWSAYQTHATSPGNVVAVLIHGMDASGYEDIINLALGGIKAGSLIRYRNDYYRVTSNVSTASGSFSWNVVPETVSGSWWGSDPIYCELIPQQTTGLSIHNASAKTTPVDADTVGIIDSDASNVLKKVTWANLKATLKAYFDTLYNLTSFASNAEVRAGSVSNKVIAPDTLRALDIGVHRKNTFVRTGIFGGVTIDLFTSMSNGQIKYDQGLFHQVTRIKISRYNASAADEFNKMQQLYNGGYISISYSGVLQGLYAVRKTVYDSGSSSFIYHVQYLGDPYNDSVFGNTYAYDIFMWPGQTLVAEQDVAEAGTDNLSLMTPLRTAQAIAALGGGGSLLYVKAADQNYSSGTSFANVTDIAFSNVPAGTYLLELELSSYANGSSTLLLLDFVLSNITINHVAKSVELSPGFGIGNPPYAPADLSGDTGIFYLNNPTSSFYTQLSMLLHITVSSGTNSFTLRAKRNNTTSTRGIGGGSFIKLTKI